MAETNVNNPDGVEQTMPEDTLRDKMELLTKCQWIFCDRKIW